jgi:hypothetical protein
MSEYHGILYPSTLIFLALQMEQPFVFGIPGIRDDIKRTRQGGGRVNKGQG